MLNNTKKEHKEEREEDGAKPLIRGNRKRSETQLNKSAIIDHIILTNHVMCWQLVYIYIGMIMDVLKSRWESNL